jgi:hypothetical protein
VGRSSSAAHAQRRITCGREGKEKGCTAKIILRLDEAGEGNGAGASVLGVKGGGQAELKGRGEGGGGEAGIVLGGKEGGGVGGFMKAPRRMNGEWCEWTGVKMGRCDGAV